MCETKLSERLPSLAPKILVIVPVAGLVDFTVVSESPMSYIEKKVQYRY